MVDCIYTIVCAPLKAKIQILKVKRAKVLFHKLHTTAKTKVLEYFYCVCIEQYYGEDGTLLHALGERVLAFGLQENIIVCKGLDTESTY